ncbi:MAG: DUF839 domain-containing protein [Thermoleophilaceae bacterium]|nr:DUF839 domain-containing protein [Thermoleophilaceae bacterium]
MTTMDRRTFVRRSATAGGGLAAASGLHMLGVNAARGQAPGQNEGYGPLVPKTDGQNTLFLPEEFNFQTISRQGDPQDDGTVTPGIFDGMGAYRGRRGRTILIRNHENRRRPGEIPVVVDPEDRYDDDPSYNAGDSKLEVSRRRAGRNPDGTPRFVFTVERSFNILGGTDTNCAGGMVGRSWVTCEEVVNRGSTGKEHGYIFEIPVDANDSVEAVPIRSAGRLVHEAVAELDGILYETEDRRIEPGEPNRRPVVRNHGSVLYRYLQDERRGDDNGDDDRDDDGPGRRDRRVREGGVLQGLKLRDEFNANMDVGRRVGQSFRVEWVTIDEPDHDDDSDSNRTSDDPRFTPTRYQAARKGAAVFDRQEGIWTTRAGGGGDDDGDGDRRRGGKLYFDCTEGGEQNLGQVWEYDPRRQRLALIFESMDPARLENPDNVVIVPKTGDIFLQEDSPGEQFVRGLTPEGEIYDFAKTGNNDTEFCGGCFDPDGHTLYLNQQGERGGPVEGPPGGQAVTYAIYGPFEKRGGRRRRSGDDDDGRPRRRRSGDDD